MRIGMSVENEFSQYDPFLRHFLDQKRERQDQSCLSHYSNLSCNCSWCLIGLIISCYLLGEYQFALFQISTLLIKRQVYRCTQYTLRITLIPSRSSTSNWALVCLSNTTPLKLSPCNLVPAGTVLALNRLVVCLGITYPSSRVNKSLKCTLM